MYLFKRSKNFVTKYLCDGTNTKTFWEYPFLTVIAYADDEDIGILQNMDTQICTMYVYGRLGIGMKKKVLGFRRRMVVGTNRGLPINIALLNRWPFGYASQSFNVKQIIGQKYVLVTVLLRG